MEVTRRINKFCGNMLLKLKMLHVNCKYNMAKKLLNFMHRIIKCSFVPLSCFKVFMIYFFSNFTTFDPINYNKIILNFKGIKRNIITKRKEKPIDVNLKNMMNN